MLIFKSSLAKAASANIENSIVQKFCKCTKQLFIYLSKCLNGNQYNSQIIQRHA